MEEERVREREKDSGVPVSFDNLRDKNLMQLKKLNTAIFPVRYNDKYYSDALSSGDFTKLGRLYQTHSFYLIYAFLFSSILPFLLKWEMTAGYI